MSHILRAHSLSGRISISPMPGRHASHAFLGLPDQVEGPQFTTRSVPFSSTTARRFTVSISGCAAAFTVPLLVANSSRQIVKVAQHSARKTILRSRAETRRCRASNCSDIGTSLVCGTVIRPQQIQDMLPEIGGSCFYEWICVE